TIYTATEKLNLNASAGFEWRQYHAGGSHTFFPVFGIGGSYFPREGTTIVAEAHRRASASIALAGQNYLSTGFSASVHQRLGGRLGVYVTGGYDNARYQSAQSGVAATRTDDYYKGSVGL